MLTPHYLVEQNRFGHHYIALLNENEELIRLFVNRAGFLRYNAIYPAQITSYHPTLRGYFVKTESGIDAFVPNHDSYTNGEHIFIQITKEARQDKAATAKIAQPDAFPPTFSESITQKYNLPLKQNWHDFDIDAQIDEALLPKVKFANGAYLTVERTKACCSIDVDSGSLAFKTTKINILATEYIVKEIYLKNLSGVILIDFCGRKPYMERQNLLKLITPYFENDEDIKINGFTKAGLLEIVRKRTTTSLLDVFLSPNGSKNPATVIYEIKNSLATSKLGNPTLYISQQLLGHLDEALKAYKIKTHTDKPLDYFEIIGE